MGKLQGRAFIFKDNVDTDQIYPGRYLELTDPKAIAAHAMEGADPAFPEKVRPGDIIVAGKNFGCGSSREHAVIALKEAGVGAVLALSFGRIFYRNAINLGLPAIRLAEAPKAAEGDLLTIDLEEGTIALPDGGILSFAPFPPEIRKIIQGGGIIPLVKSEQLG
ncbi:MAG: 3-isopropylmalate dehydratase small subunit [Firmicutes bacterium]|nr:3-isopropylmalate dehydratase small subunit [Bacillota bacterium]